MRKWLVGLLTVAAVLALFPSPAQALSTHWGPWLLCNTVGNDYHVRVRVTPVGGVYYPNAIEVRRADNAKRTPAYNDVEMEWFDGSGRRLLVGGYAVTRRTLGSRVDFEPLTWPGTLRPSTTFRLWDNSVDICVTQRVAVG